MKHMIKTRFCGFLFATSILCMIACSNTDNATQDSPPDKDKSLSKNEAEVCSQQLISEWKDKVRTDMEGSFKNVVGRVARVVGQQRVILSLSDIGLIATAYIPSAFIEKI